MQRKLLQNQFGKYIAIYFLRALLLAPSQVIGYPQFWKHVDGVWSQPGRMVRNGTGEAERMAMIIPFNGVSPTIADDVFVAPNAVIIGDVEVGPGSSIWFGAVLRGDIGPIRVGRRTNLQDNVVVHLDRDAPTTIGDDVTIGHGAIVHGTTIGSGTQIGMGAVVLSRSCIGEGSLIAAGAVVLEDAQIPAGSVVMGVPAKIRRGVTPEEREALLRRAAVYEQRGAAYRTALGSREQ